MAQHHMREVLGGNVAAEEKVDSKPIRMANDVEIDKARKIWADGIRDQNQLRPVNMPGLQALCREQGITVAPVLGKKKLQRADFVAALQHASKPWAVPVTSTNIDITELMPGLVDENIDCRKKRSVDAGTTITVEQDGLLGNREWREVRKGIEVTRRPVWQESPPPQLGMKSQGKLKADQWRTLMEFDLPVTLVIMWAVGLDESAAWAQDRRLLVVESTMLLATALRWATSNRTSQHHVDLYMENIRAYLATLRILFPETKLKPNHHNALYLGEMLMRFGPARGWWMFPFERVIGLLQKFNTNHKMGKN